MDVTPPSPPSGIMGMVLRSRLVHFLALGAMLWAVAPREREAGVLRVSHEEAARALDQARAQAGHVLGPEEQRRVLAELVAERVLAAEGFRLGLAEEDEVARARVAAKMAASLATSQSGARPTPEAIRAEAEALAPGAAERIELEAAFVGKEREDAPGEAAALARGLARGEHPREDRSPIPSHATWTEDELSRAAGPTVAHHAASAVAGSWSPPLASAWGFYVIRVLARRPASPEEVRAEAEARVLATERRAAIAAAVLRASAGYRIEVASPEGAPRFEAADLRQVGAAASPRKERVD